MQENFDEEEKNDHKLNIWREGTWYHADLKSKRLLEIGSSDNH